MNVYLLRKMDSLLLIMLYVDDLLITRSSTSSITSIKFALHDKFVMKNIGLLYYFLGLEINQTDLGIKMAHSKYAQNLLIRF